MTIKSEREYIEDARDKLRKAEALWKVAIAEVMEVVNVNEDAALANAAFGAAAELTEELSSMMRSHWRVTGILLENWPGYSDVVTRGPGR
jgi:hypothetical protein